MRARDFITENKTASNRAIVKYVQSIHQQDDDTSKIRQMINRYPRWKLREIPLSQLEIPDAYYPDDDAPGRVDPYGRTLWVDYDYAGEVSAHNVDRLPIVVDPQGNIIDGNHRAWAAAELLNRDSIQAWVATDDLKEIGDRPAAYNPNTRRKRSLFHATVNGHWVDVFFDRSDLTGALQITFTVNQNYEPAADPSHRGTAPQSVIRIFSTVLNIIKRELPRYVQSYRPEKVSFTAEGENRANLYQRMFVPTVNDILGAGYQYQRHDLGGGKILFLWTHKRALQ